MQKLLHALRFLENYKLKQTCTNVIYIFFFEEIRSLFLLYCCVAIAKIIAIRKSNLAKQKEKKNEFCDKLNNGPLIIFFLGSYSHFKRIFFFFEEKVWRMFWLPFYCCKKISQLANDRFFFFWSSRFCPLNFVKWKKLKELRR